MKPVRREMRNVAILVTSQALIIFSRVAIGALMAGQLLHRLGWEALNLAMLPLALLVTLATLWLRWSAATGEHLLESIRKVRTLQTHDPDTPRIWQIHQSPASRDKAKPAMAVSCTPVPVRSQTVIVASERRSFCPSATTLPNS